MRFAIVILLAAVFSADAQEIYDLLLKGGHIIDPKNGRNQRLDVAITAGRIRKIASSIPAAQARNLVNVGDYYVTPGLVDIHAYLTPRSKPAGVDPDPHTLRYGVTTVVDAGSAGSGNFEQFKARVIDHADVRVLAFVSTNPYGRYPTGTKPAYDAAALEQIIRKYPEVIVGVRAADASPEAAERAVKTAGSTKTIVLTTASAKQTDLHAGDIISQIYGRSPAAAQKQGVLQDTGHGAEGFWFRTAFPAIRKGLLPDTISTALDGESVMLPRATMTNVMSKFLAMGLTLEQVVERSTVRPALAIRHPDLGSMEEGGIADIAVFELRKGPVAFLDSGHGKLTAGQELRCVLTIRNGEIVWDTEGLSLTDWKTAGPYSNFK